MAVGHVSFCSADADVSGKIPFCWVELACQFHIGFGRLINYILKVWLAAVMPHRSFEVHLASFAVNFMGSMGLDR